MYVCVYVGICACGCAYVCAYMYVCVFVCVRVTIWCFPKEVVLLLINIEYLADWNMTPLERLPNMSKVLGLTPVPMTHTHKN